MGDKAALQVEVKGEVKAIGEAELLLFIYENEGMSCDEIGKKVGLSFEWVSYHVENLEVKGLVEIKKGVKDKKPVSKVYPKDLGYMDTINLEEWNEGDLKLFSKWEREGFVPEI